MLNLTANIKIGGRVFTSVASVKITTSIEDFMDTATLVLPQVERGQVKEGDEVSIELGYEDVCVNYEFFGKVNEISPASPYEIRCLDPFNDLRRQYLTHNFNRQKIIKILNHLLRNTGYSADIGLISEGRTAKLYAAVKDSWGKTLPMSIRKAIKNLAQENGFYCFFVNRRLRFLDRNIDIIMPGAIPLFREGNAILEHSLLFSEGNEILDVTVYSDSPGGIPLNGTYRHPKVKNSKIKKTFDVSGFGSDGDCKKRAKEISEQLNAPGYRGDFKTFGHPFVRAGQFCGIKMKGQEKPTIQAVRKTEVTFDTAGYRRVITPFATEKDVIKSAFPYVFKELEYFKRVAA